MQAQELFEILVRENADMLTAYIRSVVREAATSDDIFQETMLTAWRRLPDYDKSRPFGPWLRGIAAKTMLAWRRKRARAFMLCDEDILEHLGARCETIQQQPGDTWDEKLEGLRDCVSRLPDRYREVIQLRYSEEVAPETLMDRLGINAETLKKRLQRGRARLLECLERRLRWTEPLSDTTATSAGL